MRKNIRSKETPSLIPIDPMKRKKNWKQSVKSRYPNSQKQIKTGKKEFKENSVREE